MVVIGKTPTFGAWTLAGLVICSSPASGSTGYRVDTPSWGAAEAGMSEESEADYLPAPAEPRPKAVILSGEGSGFGGSTRVLYTSIDDRTYVLNSFLGRHVAVLFPDDWLGSGEDQFDLRLVKVFIDRADILFEHFVEIVGREPAPEEDRLTIAMVPTCGAGCGYVGYKGIELDPGASFRRDYIRPPFAADKIPGALYHEMAHNFDVYNAYLQYVPDGAHAWTYFMGEYSVVYGRHGELGLSPEELRRKLLDNTFYRYYDDATLNWENCVRDAQCWQPRAAWAGTLWRFAELHGPDAVKGYMRHVLEFASANPAPADAYGKNDLHVAAMAAGAGEDLGCYVDSWRWRASASLRQQMAQLYPAPVFCVDQDGDGANPAAGDCDDSDPHTFRGGVETRNGADEDCNGVVDDVLVAESPGGDFPSPQRLGLPGVASGRLGANDGDQFEFDLPETGPVTIELCALGSFQGWIFVYNRQGGWFGYHFVPADSCGRHTYDLPEAGTWRFGVELNSASSPGPYRATVLPATSWPGPSWARTRTPQPQAPMELRAIAVHPGELDPAPETVRYWVSGLGVVGQSPFAPTSALSWQPPAGTALEERAYRVQALHAGNPSTDFSAPQPLVCGGAGSVCLLGGRFEVSGEMHDFGQPPMAYPVAVMSFPGGRAESDQAVFFESFSPGNFEVGIKMVNGCSLPAGDPLRAFWVFAGGLTNAGTSILIEDTATGETFSWANPAGSFPRTLASTSAFPCNTGVTNCVRTEESACLLGGRFRVTGSMLDFATPPVEFPARVMQFSEKRAVSEQAAFFESFTPGNFELGVKMVDACSLPPGDPLRAYWAFYGGLTNADAQLEVRQLGTGEVDEWTVPAGVLPQSEGRTQAFRCED